MPVPSAPLEQRTVAPGASAGDDWLRLHAFVVRVLLGVLVGTVGYGLWTGYPVSHVLGHAVPVALCLLVALVRSFGTTMRSVTAALGLMVGAAAAVHASGGAPEAHFVFFALLPVAAVYGSRAPLALAVLFVGSHHLVLGTVAPAAVFGADVDPLLLTGVHALFVLVESLACFGAWRLGEDRRAAVARLVDLRTGELQAQTVELRRLALNDPLTGLANRSLLRSRLEELLAADGASQVVLLLVDLDDFKAVNDVHGHAVGDQVLVEVARRLREQVREQDIVARLGGDEFVVLGQGLGAPDAIALANRLLRALELPVQVQGTLFSITASIGIARTWVTGREPDELLRSADIAMYEAKAAGRCGHRLFERRMEERLVEHSELLRDLRGVVARGELELLYQPQVELTTRRVTGFEALVRWRHPMRGMVAPLDFIPAAEASGEILAIDDWVLRTASAQLRNWQDQGLAPVRMAVNVSGRRLVAGGYAETVAEVLAQTGLAGDRLEIEITESVAVEQDVAAQVLRDVRRLGVHVAIDDFGTGHSALARLQSFPLDRLKIDRSFVEALGGGDGAGLLCDATLSIARALGLSVVAEGVEHQAQAEALLRLGCASAQGWLFGRPVPATEAAALLCRDAVPTRVPAQRAAANVAVAHAR
jgi:diguanylate cyclase (GGDEF)-like protein